MQDNYHLPVSSSSLFHALHAISNFCTYIKIMIIVISISISIVKARATVYTSATLINIKPENLP